MHTKNQILIAVVYAPQEHTYIDQEDGRGAFRPRVAYLPALSHKQSLSLRRNPPNQSDEGEENRGRAFHFPSPLQCADEY